MFRNVLDAIRDGDWFYEPEEIDPKRYSRRRPQSPAREEKLEIFAERVRAGLPLWHESDRADYEEPRDAENREFCVANGLATTRCWMFECGY